MRAIFLVMIGFSVFVLADFSRDDVSQIVTDQNTGLQWQDDVNTSKKWIDAIAYCETLTLGDYTDWRLPNFNELYSIVDMNKHNPATDSVFKNVVAFNYWSSTPAAGYESYAWYINFFNGDAGRYRKSHNKYVRCVRGGQ